MAKSILKKKTNSTDFSIQDIGESLSMKNATDLNPVGTLERKLEKVFPPNTKKSFLVYSLVIGLGSMLLVLSLFFGLKIKGLNTNYSIKDFYPKQHSLLETDTIVKKAFQLRESPTLYFILTRRDHLNWLSQKPYLEMKSITDTLRLRSDIKSILGISTVEGAQFNSDGLIVGPLLENKSTPMRQLTAESNPILKPMLLSWDNTSAVIVVESKATEPGNIKILAGQVTDLISKLDPYLLVQVAGLPAVQYRIAEVIQTDLGFFMGLVVLVFCGMFFLLFRQLSIMFFAFGSLVLVNTTVIGIIAHFKIPFSAILSTLPILISISSMSILVHTLHLWSQVDHSKTLNARFTQALLKIADLALPNFLGSITTTLGFIALSSSSIPVIQKYGVVVGVSVVAAWLLTQIYLIVGLVWLSPKKKLLSVNRSSWSLLGMKYGGPILIGTLACTIGMSAFIPKIQFSSKLFDDLSMSDPIRRATNVMDKSFGGIVNYDIVLTSTTESHWKQLASLSLLRSFTNDVQKISGVGSTISHYDFLPANQLRSPAAVAESLFLFSLAAENPLKQFLTDDGRKARVLVRLHDLPSKNIQAIRDQVVRVAKSRFGSSISIQEAGLAVNSHAINHEVARQLVFGFWESLVLIGFFLVVVFRSLRWALIACIPNLIPPILLMGFMGLFETSVKPGIALIFSIVLGLAFNNTVYFLSRLKTLLEKQTSFQKSLKQALLQEGNPCAFETLIMLSGFSIFVFSSFSMNKLFGGFMVLSILFGFVADLLFLPALLSFFPRLGTDDPVRSKTPVGTRKWVAATPIVVIVFILYCFKSHALTADQVLQLSAKSVSSIDDQADVLMEIVEANNDVKTRKFKMKTMNQNGFRAMIRMQAPADIKNTGFLTQVIGNQEQQWIYLPSTKQVRRVISRKSENGILGSEVSSEDLSLGLVQKSKVALFGQNLKYHILSIQFKNNQSKYTHAFSYIDKKTFVPIRTVYFTGPNKVKTVEFGNYILLNRKIWRAQEIKVVNHLNSRRTNLKFMTYKVNVGIKLNAFSQSALKDES